MNTILSSHWKTKRVKCRASWHTQNSLNRQNNAQSDGSGFQRDINLTNEQKNEGTRIDLPLVLKKGILSIELSWLG